MADLPPPDSPEFRIYVDGLASGFGTALAYMGYDKATATAAATAHVARLLDSPMIRLEVERLIEAIKSGVHYDAHWISAT